MQVKHNGFLNNISDGKIVGKRPKNEPRPIAFSVVFICNIEVRTYTRLKSLIFRSKRHCVGHLLLLLTTFFLREGKYFIRRRRKPSFSESHPVKNPPLIRLSYQSWNHLRITSGWNLLRPYRAPCSCVLSSTDRWVHVGHLLLLLLLKTATTKKKK